MRRIVIGFMSTVSASALLFTYHTSTNSTEALGASTSQVSGTSSTDGTADTSTGQSTSSSTSSSGSSSSSSSSGSSSGSSSASGSYTGDAVDTRWGIVQVKITVANGKITKSEAVQYPQENGRDQEINAVALPLLDAAVVAQQSASIDTVSGATVTSDGYIQSLQAAIDQANL